MKPDRTRLPLAALLYYGRLLVPLAVFLGWLGFLGYLAATRTNPVIVSRSQAMASTHFVLADVRVDPASGLPERLVTVVEDLRPGPEPIDPVIAVSNIKEARVAGDGGLKDRGRYLLLLTRTSEGFVLTPPPLAPGDAKATRTRPWAYSWDAPGVREQFESLVPKRPAD